MGEERVFTARVQVLERVAVPKVIVEDLGIKKGDVVEVRIKKMGRVKEQRGR